MIQTDSKGRFIKGNPPPKHKEGCKCFRCSKETQSKHLFKKGHKRNMRTRFKKGHKPIHTGKGILKHPAWKGFRMTNNRSSSFRKAIMEEIKCCEICGFKNPYALVVHHIDKNGKNNERENLILLCANCHYIKHKGKFTKEND